MIEKILPNLYKIDIPLPGNPLKAVNSYIIKGQERNLIIDTGWNREECRNAMHAGLKELHVDLRKTDFFITHLHTDHIGLILNLATETSNIYFNHPDADSIENSTVRWNSFLSFARMSGLPESELHAVLDRHPGYKYRIKGHIDFTILKEDDLITMGEYSFKCVETPGHTEGHMCLYEPKKKIFVSGDHILNSITPNIQLWCERWNPLKTYLMSLDKVSELDIELVLPGHRSIFKNCKGRIQELKDHHQKRADEVLSILGKGSQDAFQVASQMSWDIADVYDSFDLFPITQKWFATGEAIAHLKYLEEKGVVRRKLWDNKISYSWDLKPQFE
jgi:glyoxylase-like metal-dependent hydrolase (beta-lactamase superfamily II)